MRKLKTGITLVALSLGLSFSSLGFACDTFDPGEDSDTSLSNCVNAGCDTENAGCATYCNMQSFSPE